LYQSKGDIKEIQHLILEIRSGRVSRNKNFFTLSKAREFSRFKRAKLLISLVEDIERTLLVEGNQIRVNEESDHMSLSLFNPLLRYNRKVYLSKPELKLLSSLTEVLPVP